MRQSKIHIHFFAFLLLVCMLKVAFPVGEFFHNHLSEKEVCAHVNGKKCDHSTHISQAEKHHDCVYLQLHHSFVLSTFSYHLLEVMTVLYFSLVKRQQSLPPLPLSPEGLLPLPFIVDYQHGKKLKILTLIRRYYIVSSPCVLFTDH